MADKDGVQTDGLKHRRYFLRSSSTFILPVCKVIIANLFKNKSLLWLI
jgi:hypothetical protein